MTTTPSNLTRFFRNAGHFKALAHVIVPDVVARKERSGVRTFSLWSVGCSTGEEPLSVAILLREILPTGFEPRIVAIDSDRRAVDFAVRGVYSEAQVDGVPRRLRGRCFQRGGEGLRAVAELRRCISFECRSVEESEESGVYDIVMCRNLLTYADEAGRRVIAARLWEAMAPYSYLLVGGSESLLGVDERFEYLANDWCATYRKRPDGRGRYESADAPLG